MKSEINAGVEQSVSVPCLPVDCVFATINNQSG